MKASLPLRNSKSGTSLKGKLSLKTKWQKRRRRLTTWMGCLSLSFALKGYDFLPSRCVFKHRHASSSDLFKPYSYNFQNLRRCAIATLYKAKSFSPLRYLLLM